ncbi:MULTISPECIES: arylesterase [Arenibacter]|uniref:arylesterase n=1 Tax=Arenibacter TaxID=178469 RepID=UPI000A3A5697|nr:MULTISPECIES: arylesterase [Arenibacter]
MRSLLSFCYLFTLSLLISCGEKSPKKSEDVEVTTKQEDTATSPTTDQKTILFYGNSLTAGMGLDPTEAFPELIQKKLDSLGFKYQVINAGLSGETSASGKNRVSWVLKQKVDVFVLELGANDGLRGIPLQETRTNLQAIIDTVKDINPETVIILAGMQIPPNMGPEYTKEFRELFPQLAKENNLPLIPFLLKDVAGVPELNQADGIHPTAEGQRIIAKNIWPIIEKSISK